MTLSRRTFVKLAALAPSVFVAPLGSQAFAALFEDKVFEPRRWYDEHGNARFRADGVAKVTGEKIFARDIRAWDMPHWPARQSHAFLLATTRVDAVFEGVDLSVLGSDLQPDRTVTEHDLRAAKLGFPDIYPYGDQLLLPKGSAPAFFGHPVAILIYHDFARFRLAKSQLKFRKEVIRYGRTATPVLREPYAAFRIVRVAGAVDGAPDEFSALSDDYVMPTGFSGNEPVWPKANPHGDAGQRGVHYAQGIARELAKPSSDHVVFSRDYDSPFIDPVALEANNCNCWYDARKHEMHMVVATQSPSAEASGVDAMLKASRIKAGRIFVHPAHTVGYGSKDSDTFPFYGAVAALFSDGRPVRLAFDRFEQFQMGLKRHPVRARLSLAVDRRTHKMQTLSAKFELDGGGRCMWTPIITLAAAGAATSIYAIPKVDSIAVGIASTAPPASAMRGVGGTEAEPAIEMLVDEIASELGIDPIEFRIANALPTGVPTITGDVPVVPSRIVEVLKKTAAHTLWRNRAQDKAAFEAAHPGHKYGVGVACVQRGFGNFAEAGYAGVVLAPDGTLRLKHVVIEIGTGSLTTQALVCAQWLGTPASHVEMGALDWSELDLHETQDPYSIDEATQTRLAKDQRWTPRLSSGASATNSAYYSSHYTRQACRLMFMHGIAPAAAQLWRVGLAQARTAKWVDGHLTLAGQPPLSLPRLAGVVHAMKFVSGVAVHGFDRWEWAEADFAIDGEKDRLPLDAVAVSRGSGVWQKIARGDVRYPPPSKSRGTWTRYASLSSLVAVDVEVATGKTEIVALHSVMDCGTMLVPEFVSGQLQGGTAMGLGHALFEEMPPYAGGPGEGDWNLSRYHVPRAEDVAVWKQTADILPPLAEGDIAKGIAEMTMVAPIPAAANAVAHAIGARIRELPVTPERILKVLA
ncbi:xanthine dehydrogenase family protein molybdopterin-binding subunit [Pandoraea sp. PE-S2R-1]|uniref:xanthine dehydrogenase family protein molybdopterin-binding subunit n=1 Tax=Pandoraea sp. PE-S2R-1 TaxID=1986994 RepID=UPI000B3FEEE9|nr:molybdopterin cofactor-binding domain-containing protein [Pandoraea sp. PE-S2R-1]